MIALMKRVRRFLYVAGVSAAVLCVDRGQSMAEAAARALAL